ncbi:UbiX family flavin prenyltransferase [Desulfocurvibacter africanus]|uniref:Flavin prenyltransferase UbiX n=1 Tax=Desulfocurvibacter africanus subsp. africanus str. Walvis Bay TaxID=690850 RepID=F3Z2J4_DESAF|nr:UbiX family flavin prenyltransferase [Desulfocurvibacter africanus]EGJ51327.1 3-octaprenyl-4-hydroxybenzoate carboxy-lyase [Desulfocurvibacter africanus subsp. africanus str. Walvis Bay]
MSTRRILLGVTGASGMPYTFKLAKVLGETPGMELHLILSKAAKQVLALEADEPLEALTTCATAVYSDDDLAAPPASGSWLHQGMVICPCSMNSLAAVSQGLAGSLLHRAADVTLKEGRPLVLVPRETPLNRVHLRNLLSASEAGAVILPAMPAFYHRPRSVADVVDHLVARILDRLGVSHELSKRWNGLPED